MKKLSKSDFDRVMGKFGQRGMLTTTELNESRTVLRQLERRGFLKKITTLQKRKWQNITPTREWGWERTGRVWR